MKTQCPRCHSFKTTSQRAAVFYLACGFVLTGFLLSFLVFPLVLVPVGLALFPMCLLLEENKMTCQECKMVFTR